MKFDNDLVQILKNFATINQSIVFKPGNVVSTMSNSETVLAKAKVEQEVPAVFAIYELNRFLSTLSLFSDPDITIHDKFMEIRQGGRKVNYNFAEPSFIVSPPDKELDLPDPEVSFVISSEQLSELTKALAILSLPEIAIAGDGEKIYVKTADSKNSGADVYSLEIGETDKKFNLIIRAENLKLLPGDYKIEASSRGISKWEGENIEYYVAVEANSVFGS